MIDEQLICEIKNAECLWNRSNPDYHNKRIRNINWQDVAYQCKSNKEDCRKRWKELRNRFMIELACRTRPSSSSSDFQHIDTSEWHLFHHMLFLKDTIKTNKYEEVESTSTFSIPLSEDDQLSAMLNLSIPQDYEIDEKYEASEKTDCVSTQRDSKQRTHSAASGEIYYPSDKLVKLNMLEKKVLSLSTQLHQLVLSKIHDNDSFLASIGEIFAQVPRDKQLRFKMDVLNFTFQSFESISEP